MSAAAQPTSQTAHPDGRIELPAGLTLTDPRFANEDLKPVPVANRRWTTYNFLALWVGMAHNIPSWTLASGLVALGMDWKQAVLTIALANVIVLAPMLLTGHAGTRYGIPFPVFARASFGLRGANLPALVRALVACAWFGIQSWIGGEGIFLLSGKLLGHGWQNASPIGGYPWTQWLSFFLFWAIELAVIARGMETLRRIENWAAPFVIAGALALLVWISVKAGGFGPLLSQPTKLGWGSGFWKVFFPSLMGMIGFWSTLSLNIPDFTRFGGSQRAQIRGQALGLPTTMTLFALLSVLVTSGSQAVYGTPIWDPIALAAKMDSVAGVLLALLTVLIATLSVNIAANVVSPAYDLANLWPKLINFRTGALITCVVGVAIFPWKLVSNPHIYIFTWLGVVGGLLGTVAGVLIADYWILRRTHLQLAELYRPEGRYWYSGGWNWRAVAAFVVGGVLAVGGSYSTVDAKGVKQGPFPTDGLIPFLKPLADYGWAVGVASALVLYVILTRAAPAVRSVDAAEPVAAPLTGDTVA
ncbi:NCS1 family nucleobase:cation symporter-1 [Streptantibioticus ferralitis]|uniref:NCS1 family nucleobase:cation symporter-1 n=1 Tax=Streptantibioticus ferralitis TaxID=236510 RepID=A0ABT5YU82_9ACTN|nr:NCS1 family nucleobase:cation symporter-1 [Streptantibioticus ferralitis]MDF2255173.1 NCS1 family nucleobase:cation symporter-1 [Streptantibioticus ferralitis]